MRSKCLLLLLCIRLLLLPSAARCSSLPWSKRPNDQSLGLGLKKMWLVVAWLVAKISGIATQRIPPLVPDCVWCACGSGGFGVTRVALKRRIDAGRLMAQLASAFIYCCMPQLRLSHMCHRERGVRGVSSVVSYAVLCPLSGGLCGLLCRVTPWSGACV